MRMAEIRVKRFDNGQRKYVRQDNPRYFHPDKVIEVFEHIDFGWQITIIDRGDFVLDMPLDEALEELNAAMNYTKEVEDVESSAKALFEYWKKQYEEVWKSERK